MSTKETSKQNITRDIVVKNNLTIARGEWGGDNGETGLCPFLIKLYEFLNYFGYHCLITGVSNLFSPGVTSALWLPSKGPM